MRVYVGGMRGKLETVPAERDITFRDLLTHTSGLTYGFMEATPVDAQYRDRGVDFQTSDKTLGEVVELAADIPLIAQPGAEWNYSIATDVLGHLVAVISGQPFDEFLCERVTGPLGMVDTAFHVPADKITRFAANYTSAADGRLMLIDDPQWHGTRMAGDYLSLMALQTAKRGWPQCLSTRCIGHYRMQMLCNQRP